MKMMKRLFPCVLLAMLCAYASFSQTKRGTQPAQTGLKPGYYFTIDMCRACYYSNWDTEIARLFQAKGVRATLYEGAMMETKTEPFAPVKIFTRRGLWKDLVYVGPFASAEAATAALDKFPSVLAVVQKKANKMLGNQGEGWSLSEDEKVRRTEGNDYKYGFYEIKGCKLLAP